jgi:hypothetical protein
MEFFHSYHYLSKCSERIQLMISVFVLLCPRKSIVTVSELHPVKVSLIAVSLHLLQSDVQIGANFFIIKQILIQSLFVMDYFSC